MSIERYWAMFEFDNAIDNIKSAQTKTSQNDAQKIIAIKLLEIAKSTFTNEYIYITKPLNINFLKVQYDEPYSRLNISIRDITEINVSVYVENDNVIIYLNREEYSNKISNKEDLETLDLNDRVKYNFIKLLEYCRGDEREVFVSASMYYNTF